MSCQAYRRLCKRLVISNSVTFTGGNLVINIPQDNYRNDEKYCIVVAQSIPADTTITAPVVITIGSNTTTYPLVNCDCTNVYACSINTRTRYSVIVHTNINSGVFSVIDKLPCSRCANYADSLPVAAPTTTTTINTNEILNLVNKNTKEVKENKDEQGIR